MTQQDEYTLQELKRDIVELKSQLKYQSYTVNILFFLGVARIAVNYAGF